MLKIQYRIKTGRKLNLKTPKRFTEKLQWYKLYHRNPLMVRCVDKFDVRDYIKQLGYANILNECYGVFNSPEEISFSSLPNSFVLKDTLGAGGNSIFICRDKNTLDLEKLKNTLASWVKQKKFKSGGREWPYYSGKNSRILVEKYIETTDISGLVDYKFFCFDGVFKYLYIMSDREIGRECSLRLFDSNLNKLDVKRTDERFLEDPPKLPENISEMIKIAEDLSKEFPHARVDLYNVHGKILFGEITFFDGSGYMQFEPDDFDITLGNCFMLSKF